MKKLTSTLQAYSPYFLFLPFPTIFYFKLLSFFLLLCSTFNLFIAPPWQRSDINRKEGGKTISVEYSVYFRISLKKRHVPKGQSLKEGANINCNTI